MPKRDEKYTSPNVFVDVVIFQLIDNELSVLLIKRAREPYKGRWALPGGHNPVGETTAQSMSRSLYEKAGIKTERLELLEQLYTFDSLHRDPRGPALTLAYLSLSRNLIPKASKSTLNPQFFPVNDLPELAFDHNHIIEYAKDRLASKILYSNIAFALLPRLFTLSRLQEAHEAILGRKLDKRNYRKKYLSLGLIEATTEYHMNGAHRPAKLYRFINHKIEYLSRSFDETI
ncbi:MAG TPA: NUDIX domain-containing protein [Candidatus Saccharimonadales bacterium]|nr:NUDIX domain-containing protein [Candidatus Saccharimonadales bacterium]